MQLASIALQSLSSTQLVQHCHDIALRDINRCASVLLVRLFEVACILTISAKAMVRTVQHIDPEAGRVHRGADTFAIPAGTGKCICTVITWELSGLSLTDQALVALPIQARTDP
jgi:hypothetical protein